MNEDRPLPAIGRRLPPVTQIAMASLALIVAGGIYLSAHLPRHVPLLPAVILLAASAGLLLANLIALSRVSGFPWSRFVRVAQWSMLAYLVIAGMIEYAFLRNHLRGGALVVLTLSLVVFSVHVPTLVGFTVARYFDPESEEEPSITQSAAGGGRVGAGDAPGGSGTVATR
jgi:hypothetical protein